MHRTTGNHRRLDQRKASATIRLFVEVALVVEQPRHRRLLVRGRVYPLTLRKRLANRRHVRLLALEQLLDGQDLDLGVVAVPTLGTIAACSYGPLLRRRLFAECI